MWPHGEHRLVLAGLEMRVEHDLWLPLVLHQLRKALDGPHRRLEDKAVENLVDEAGALFVSRCHAQFHIARLCGHGEA